MMKQQIVLQDMSEAPKDREILVGVRSEVDNLIRFDKVVYDKDAGSYPYDDDDGDDSEPGFPSPKNTWFSENEEYYYSNDDFIGWIEVPVLPQAK